MTADGLSAAGLAHCGSVHLEQPGNTIFHDKALDACIHLTPERGNSYCGYSGTELMIMSHIPSTIAPDNAPKVYTDKYGTQSTMTSAISLDQTQTITSTDHRL